MIDAPSGSTIVGIMLRYASSVTRCTMDVEATRVRSRVIYIESKAQSLQGRIPIGRVTFPEGGIRKLLGIATIALMACFMERELRGAAASDVTPLRLTTLSMIPASGPIDRLWDYVAHSNGLYFLVEEHSGLIEVVHSDFTGALLHRFPLNASSHRGGRIAISQAGMLAVLLFTSRNSSDVWLYTPGDVPVVTSVPQDFLEIAFSGSNLFVASTDQIFRIARNGDGTVPGAISSLSPRLDRPFALLPMVDGKLGLVEFTTAQLHLAAGPQLTTAFPSALLGGDEVQQIPDEAVQNGAGKLYDATSDELGRIYLGLPNFQPHKDTVLQLDANGAVLRRLNFAVVPASSPERHVYPVKLRVTSNRLFVSYSAYQDRVAYYQFQ
jgi:hypothetical protein